MPQVNGVQRPFMKRVEDIGFWQDAFEVLSVISIVVNCSLIGIRGQVTLRKHYFIGIQVSVCTFLCGDCYDTYR